VGSGQGKRLLDTIRSEIKNMQQYEEKVLATLEIQAENDTLINYVANYTGIGLTLVLFTIGFFVITSALNHREKLEKQLVQKNEELGTLNEELRATLEEAQASNELIQNYTHLLEEKNQSLAYLNKELESFSYSISHDLKSPLHTIAGFAGLLSQTQASVLDEEANRMIGIIEKNALRMDGLISDLLRFSRLGKASIKKTTTDMHALVQQVIRQLQETQPVQKYQFKVAKLPAMVIDGKLMYQVWENLLSNAVKFSSRNAFPFIEVGCQQEPGKVTFFVRDNGIGFDSIIDDPFGVFKRLHTNEGFEGNGIGLAIVERIILHHGGEVWAESAPGNGATFYFLLPQTL
jgi:light-regulated signal transduction histidine kinase (bacteriophytochrome)